MIINSDRQTQITNHLKVALSFSEEQQASSIDKSMIAYGATILSNMTTIGTELSSVSNSLESSLLDLGVFIASAIAVNVALAEQNATTGAAAEEANKASINLTAAKINIFSNVAFTFFKSSPLDSAILAGMTVLSEAYRQYANS